MRLLSLLTAGGMLWLIPMATRAANAPPSVRLTSPLHGAFATIPARLSLVASASDSDGSVTKVEFYDGTNQVAAVTNAPFAFSWTNASAGNHDLTAVATDNGGLSTTSAAASVSVLTNGATVKVMPLGDSITDGFTSPGGYRVRLWTNLGAAGLSVNFVGSETNGPPELGDTDHEGHSGYLIGPGVPTNTLHSLYEFADTWLSNAQPDVVLLLIGANDMVNDYDVTNAPARLGGLLDKIYTNSPNAHVIVSSLTPFDDTDTAWTEAARYVKSRDFNAQLPDLVATKQAAGRRISFMDGAKSITRYDLVDGIHPSTNGYANLGDFWYAALLPVLTGQAPPDAVLTAPADGFKFTAPSNLTITATATNFGSAIKRVEFYQDDVKIGEVTNAPYTVTASNLTSGRFRFAVRTVNTNGAATVSTTATVQDQLVFEKGININGPTARIDGYDWIAYTDATNSGFNILSNVTFASPSLFPFAFIPPVYDPSVKSMLQNIAFATDATQPLTMTQTVSNGYHRVYFWVLEDFGDNARSLSFKVQGVTVAANVFTVLKGTWTKFGPYPAVVTNGVLEMQLLRYDAGGPSICGLNIFRYDVTNTAPSLSTITNRVINKNRTLGPVAFTVGDDFTATSNLVLSATSTNTTLVPNANIVLGGSDSNRTVTITPATNQFGDTQITLSAMDDLGLAVTTSFLLTVTPTNQPPTPMPQSLTLGEETPLVITLTATDLESTNINYAIATGPAHGAITGFNTNTGVLTYTPVTNFYGADSFTFTAADGDTNSAPATISLTITNINDPPVAGSQCIILGGLTNKLVTLVGSDVDSSNLTFIIVTAPTNGSLSGLNATNGTVTYSPATNFIGPDRFTFSVSDGQLTSAVATVQIVTNHPPVVRLVNPLNGAFAVAPASVTFLATTSDPETNITGVAFYEGTNWIASVTNAPWCFIWSNVAAGSYSLTAVATDTFVSSTSAVAHITVLTNGGKIRVMPLGDSITSGAGYGGAYPGAYRVQLASNFTAAGLGVDFVGSFTNGPAPLGDFDHNGLDGALIGPSLNTNNLHTNVDALLTAIQPDLVLLLAGAEDVFANEDFTNAPARLGGLIDKILSHTNASNTTVLVSTLPPLLDFGASDLDWDTRTRFFNAALSGVVSNRAAAGQRVSLVDAARPLTRYDLPDGKHPGTNAYSKLANGLYGGMFPLLTCKAAPLVSFDSPTNNFTFTSPTNLVLTASAADADGTVARVEFFRENELIGVKTNAPFAFTVTNLTAGRYHFCARAVDNDGAASLSTATTVQDDLVFVAGVNLGGPAATEDGYTWLAAADAAGAGLTFSSNVLT
ncbi:MAG: tandem-95 repeat protein [Verrucomicrobia bacterium]|nr:tandem-95 repeat protein [Verrucomicrobiota bacterium]